MRNRPIKQRIDAHECVVLNGYRQDIRILGDCPKNPLILVLHGGPGFPNRHEILRCLEPLTPYATLVCYDQRGSGKAYQYNERQCQPLSLALLVDDAAAIAAWALKRFGQDRLILMGHSFGSLLGVLLIQKYPDMITKFIATGMLADVAENEAACYAFVCAEARRRQDYAALRHLASIPSPRGGRYRTLNEMGVIGDLIRKYGGEQKNGHAGLVQTTLLPLLRTSEYTWGDIRRYARGIRYSTEQLWSETCAISLSRTANRLPIPVLMITGSHDRNTPAEVSRRYYARLEASKKQWIELPDVAHVPYLENPPQFCQIVRQYIVCDDVIPVAAAGELQA